MSTGNSRPLIRMAITADTTTAASRSASPSWARTSPRTSTSPTSVCSCNLDPGAHEAGPPSMGEHHAFRGGRGLVIAAHRAVAAHWVPNQPVAQLTHLATADGQLHGR